MKWFNVVLCFLLFVNVVIFFFLINGFLFDNVIFIKFVGLWYIVVIILFFLYSLWIKVWSVWLSGRLNIVLWLFGKKIVLNLVLFVIVLSFRVFFRCLVVFKIFWEVFFLRLWVFIGVFFFIGFVIVIVNLVFLNFMYVLLNFES